MYAPYHKRKKGALLLRTSALQRGSEGLPVELRVQFLGILDGKVEFSLSMVVSNSPPPVHYAQLVTIVHHPCTIYILVHYPLYI